MESVHTVADRVYEGLRYQLDCLAEGKVAEMRQGIRNKDKGREESKP